MDVSFDRTLSCRACAKIGCRCTETKHVQQAEPVFEVASSFYVVQVCSWTGACTVEGCAQRCQANLLASTSFRHVEDAAWDSDWYLACPRLAQLVAFQLAAPQRDAAAAAAEPGAADGSRVAPQAARRRLLDEWDAQEAVAAARVVVHGWRPAVGGGVRRLQQATQGPVRCMNVFTHKQCAKLCAHKPGMSSSLQHW